jgi:hypothetical protein
VFPDFCRRVGLTQAGAGRPRWPCARGAARGQGQDPLLRMVRPVELPSAGPGLGAPMGLETSATRRPRGCPGRRGALRARSEQPRARSRRESPALLGAKQLPSPPARCPELGRHKSWPQPHSVPHPEPASLRPRVGPVGNGRRREELSRQPPWSAWSQPSKPRPHQPEELGGPARTGPLCGHFSLMSDSILLTEASPPPVLGCFVGV